MAPAKWVGIYMVSVNYQLTPAEWRKCAPGNWWFVAYLAQMHFEAYPDSKIHGANMGPIWGRQVPGGPYVGPMNFAIWVF